MLTSTFKLSSRTYTVCAWGIPFVLAILAWIPTLQQSLAMRSMLAYSTMGQTPEVFLLFWTPMMAAMMLPALAPAVSAQLMSFACQKVLWLIGIGRALFFISGYLLIWSLAGLLVFYLCVPCEKLVEHFSSADIWIIASTFIVVGIYQFTKFKSRCLLHCNPLLSGAMHTHTESMGRGSLADLRAGLVHGLTCVGCCGALMLLLIPVGLMNVTWMLLLTLLIFLEKVWSRGDRLAHVTGAVLICCGAGVLIDPSLLTLLLIR